jgi:hypothetical protein
LHRNGDAALVDDVPHGVRRLGIDRRAGSERQHEEGESRERETSNPADFDAKHQHRSLIP